MNADLLAEIVTAYQAQDFTPIRRMFTLHEKGVDYVCPIVALVIVPTLASRSTVGPTLRWNGRRVSGAIPS